MLTVVDWRWPMYSRGLGDPSINPTTMWTRSTGFLSTPGDPASAFGGPASYVAPAQLGAPACSQDTRPGGAAFSSECIALLLANQQADMQSRNNANYTVDRSNCEQAWAENDSRYASMGLPRPSNDCAGRSFGLTPVGGYTSDARVTGAGGQTILDAAGNVVSGAPVTSTPNAYTAPAYTPAPSSPAPISSPAPAGSGQTTNYVPLTQQAAAVLGGNVDVAGFNLPVWGIAAAALAAFMLFGGKR